MYPKAQRKDLRSQGTNTLSVLWTRHWSWGFFGTRYFRFYENPNNQQLQKRHVLQLLNSSRTHGTPIVNQVKSRKTLNFKSVNNIVRNLGRRLVSPSLFEPSLVRISIAGNPENVFNKIDHDSLQKPGSAETGWTIIDLWVWRPGGSPNLQGGNSENLDANPI